MSRATDTKGERPKAAHILIVDDHPLVRERLAELINAEPDLRVCGEAEDHASALAAVEQQQPDLVMVDLSLKRSHGLELIKDLAARHPRLAVLVVSMHDETLYAERALRAGARGYITKQEATRNILTALRRVLAGHLFLSETEARHLASKLTATHPDPTPATAIEQLSDRELTVFELIGKGYTARQIADRLHLDVKTVESHRGRLKSKLKLRDLTELLQLAIRWTATRGRS